MTRRRLQNLVSESSLTLPVVVAAALLFWWPASGVDSFSSWTFQSSSARYALGLLCYAIATYSLLETNSVCLLLRIRSRMVSSTFLFMAVACGFLHPLTHASLALLGMAVAFYQLLSSYETDKAQVGVFNAYLAIGLGSLLWAPMLLLALVMLWNQLAYLRNLTWRHFRAALIGLLLPYWFWLAWCAYDGDLTPLVHQAHQAIAPITGLVTAFSEGRPLLADTYLRWLQADNTNPAFAALMADESNALSATWTAMNNVTSDEGFHNVMAWSLAHLPRVSALVVVALMALTGYIHYRRKSYDDKIRVRMFFYCFMTMQVVCGLWLLLQPAFFDELFPLLLLTTAPTAAHFFALTHTRMTNLWFVLITLMLVMVLILNELTI